MTLPNFFIVGAAKSGTTSLYHYLKQHPDVFMPRLKEPHYFVDWKEHVKDIGEYEALFSGWSGEKAVGEASTGYLFDCKAPARIKELIPGARIIVMLRNPVDMAFALWRHMRRIGKRGEKRSFPRALEAEPKRMADPSFAENCRMSWHANFYYFSRALYYEQVKRYIDAFSRDRVLVFIFEDFSRDPLGASREAFRFLGVDTGFVPVIKRHNEGFETYHRGLARLLDRPPRCFSRLGGVQAFLKRLNARPAARLDEGLRGRLLERYRPDIEKLEELVGRDLSGWYKG